MTNACLCPHTDFQHSWCSLICSAPDSPLNTRWFKFYQYMFSSCSCHFIWNLFHNNPSHPMHPFLFSQIHKDRQKFWAKWTTASLIILAILHSMWLLHSTHKSHLQHLKPFYDICHSPTTEVRHFSCSHRQCLRIIFHTNYLPQLSMYYQYLRNIKSGTQ